MNTANIAWCSHYPDLLVSMKETGQVGQPMTLPLGGRIHSPGKKDYGIHELLLQLLKNYPDGSISIVDGDYNIVYTEGELYQQLKIHPSDLIGKSVFSFFPPSLQEKVESELAEVFDGATISDLELPGCGMEANSYALEAFPLHENENNVIRKIGIIITNITKAKKAEHDLITALEKEKALSELKTRFVSMASHEFRTPLSTILSSCYLLSKYTITEDQVRRERHVERIVASVNTLTDIINDFLSLGKIEEGKISVKPVPINIRELMTSIVGEVQPLLKPKQVIEYTHSGDEISVLDRTLLKSISLNLLSNAIKFSGENSKIELRTRRNAAFILSVRDRGIGISAEDQKYLFERFFRGANAANIQGTGLGLHIVKRYAELMNGKVSCKSTLDEGTEFTVQFRMVG